VDLALGVDEAPRQAERELRLHHRHRKALSLRRGRGQVGESKRQKTPENGTGPPENPERAAS
jgi:hypothetical protein